MTNWQTISPEPVVSIASLSKTFPGTRALINVPLDIRPGEVHALIGQNGSGKSTLFKILSGYHAPDPGASIKVRGREIRLPIQPGDLPRLGFRFVHQDLGVAETMTVLENIRIGRFQTRAAGNIDWKRERNQVEQLMQTFGVEIDPDAVIKDLTQAERAIVAILRALQSHGDHPLALLVLDEPTAYLPPPEKTHLFDAVRRLKVSGVGVLFTTHRLDEVKDLSDRVSVLRDGHLVGTYETAQVTEQQLVTALIGRDLGKFYPDPPSGGTEKVALSVRGLCRYPVEDVTFAVHAGEVLGITGLVGMGHDEIPYLIYGSLAATAGQITVGGKQYHRLTPRLALELGLGLLPANRQRHSGIQRATLKENVTMLTLRRYFRWGRIEHQREHDAVRQLLGTFDVKPRPDPDLPLNSLSGGNQQKALLSKWLNVPHLRTVILHEPTQGVDVGSRKSIFGFIRQTADAGTAVILVSAEYEDLAHLCDRVLVIRSGRVAAELTGSDLTKERIIEQCYASERASALGE